jgi:hypothetical protein
MHPPAYTPGINLRDRDQRDGRSNTNLPNPRPGITLVKLQEWFGLNSTKLDLAIRHRQHVVSLHDENAPEWTAVQNAST